MSDPILEGFGPIYKFWFSSEESLDLVNVNVFVVDIRNHFQTVDVFRRLLDRREVQFLVSGQTVSDPTSPFFLFRRRKCRESMTDPPVWIIPESPERKSRRTLV